MICFCYVCQKKQLFFILGVAHADLLVVQIGPKKSIFRGFTNFFRNYWTATEAININWIPWHISLEINKKSGCGLSSTIWAKLEVQCCEKTKKLVLSMGFFQILHEEYI